MQRIESYGLRGVARPEPAPAPSRTRSVPKSKPVTDPEPRTAVSRTDPVSGARQNLLDGYVERTTRGVTVVGEAAGLAVIAKLKLRRADRRAEATVVVLP